MTTQADLTYAVVGSSQTEMKIDPNIATNPAYQVVKCDQEDHTYDVVSGAYRILPIKITLTLIACYTQQLYISGMGLLRKRHFCLEISPTYMPTQRHASAWKYNEYIKYNNGIGTCIQKSTVRIRKGVYQSASYYWQIGALIIGEANQFTQETAN